MVQVATLTSSTITVVSRSKRAQILSVGIKTSSKDLCDSMHRLKIDRIKQFHPFLLSVTNQLQATLPTLSIVSKLWPSRMNKEMRSLPWIKLLGKKTRASRTTVIQFSRYQVAIETNLELGTIEPKASRLTKRQIRGSSSTWSKDRPTREHRLWTKVFHRIRIKKLLEDQSAVVGCLRLASDLLVIHDRGILPIKCRRWAVWEVLKRPMNSKWLPLRRMTLLHWPSPSNRHLHSTTHSTRETIATVAKQANISLPSSTKCRPVLVRSVRISRNQPTWIFLAMQTWQSQIRRLISSRLSEVGQWLRLLPIVDSLINPYLWTNRKMCMVSMRGMVAHRSLSCKCLVRISV